MTVLELALMLGIFTVVAIKATMVMTEVSKISRSESSGVVIEDQAYRVLDMIALAIMGSDRDTLVPDAESPLHSRSLRYSVNLGLEDGEIVWSNPERIAVGDDPSQLVWTENPEMPDEHRVVWTNLLRPFIEGESENGVDDNDNGLVDERGLSFEVDRNSVTIRITLEKMVNGASTTHSVETTVTCRNVLGG